MSDFKAMNRVLGLADLERGDGPAGEAFAGTSLAVLGHPIAHSLSPQMHNGALAALVAQGEARLADWRYYAFDVPPDDLPRALRILRARGFRGLNLTVPHKVLAVSEVAEIDPAARPVGAVNTLLGESAAGWRGFNTDGYGLAAAVREMLGLDFGGRPVLLLGAGGAARGAAVECLAQGCSALWIANRTAANLHALVRALEPLAAGENTGGSSEGNRTAKPPVRTRLQGFSPERVPHELPPGALVINATSAGLRSGDPAPIDLAALPRPAGVFDMVYNPPETALLRQARELGIPCANGLSMLVHQGAKALEIWSSIPAEQIAPLMRQALADGVRRAP